MTLRKRIIDLTSPLRNTSQRPVIGQDKREGGEKYINTEMSVIMSIHKLTSPPKKKVLSHCRVGKTCHQTSPMTNRFCVYLMVISETT